MLAVSKIQGSPTITSVYLLSAGRHILEPRNKFSKKINAVYTISRDEQPPAFYIHCVSHCADLMTQTYDWLSSVASLSLLEENTLPGTCELMKINIALTIQCFIDYFSKKEQSQKVVSPSFCGRNDTLRSQFNSIHHARLTVLYTHSIWSTNSFPSKMQNYGLKWTHRHVF